MREISIHNGLRAEVAQADSPRVCYLLLPGGLQSEARAYLEDAAQRFRCTMVALCGLNWNDDLTPWPAEGVFKQKKPFGGKADAFLQTMMESAIPQIEKDLGLSEPERHLLGVSLSGLFAVWAGTQTAAFSGIAAISASLWYDGFAEWFCAQNVANPSLKVHISLGWREKDTREPRMKSVEDCTEMVVRTMRAQGLSPDYQLVNATHFSPILPRIELALSKIL